MALIEFKNLPDTSTPINAENLNNNFNELNNRCQQDITTGGNAVKCGYKSDGEDVYIKRFAIDALPNASNMSIPVNEPNINILEIKGIAKNSVGYSIPLPQINPTKLGAAILITYDPNNGNIIYIATDHDYSAYSGFVDLIFTYNN